MKPSAYQKDIYKIFTQSSDNINISAVAGSGKTTVLIELLKLLPKDKTAVFMAFNNSIVDELKERIKTTAQVQVTTIHSYGWRAIMNRYGHRAKMNPNKAIGKVERVLKRYDDIKPNRSGWYFYIIPKIADLLSCNLLDATKDNI